MNAQDFKAAWEAGGDTVYRYAADDFTVSQVPDEAEHFLTTAGLPTEAAPCLSFGKSSLDWVPEGVLPEHLNSCLPIGSDGSGNPIVLDAEGTALLLDHDRGFEASYVNKDVATLAEALLRYRELIAEASQDADFDGELPEVLRQRFADFLRKLDPQCLRPNQMWAGELLCL
ncbi:SUKH-4 family immunity protein [Sphingopyxis sp. NJF-3]